MPDPKINVHDMSPATVANARRLYEAYNANSGWLNYQGKPCPPWAELPEAIQSNWCRVVGEALVLDLTSVEQGGPPCAAPEAVPAVPEPTQDPAPRLISVEATFPGGVVVDGVAAAFAEALPTPTAPEPVPAGAAFIGADEAIARVRDRLVQAAESNTTQTTDRIAVLSSALAVLHNSPRHLAPPTAPASPPEPSTRLLSIEVIGGKLVAAGTVYPYTGGDADRRAEVADYLDRISTAVREGGWDVLEAPVG